MPRQAEEYALSSHIRPQPTLTIGDLAERTGVPPATVRSWEARYGFPRPERLASGHRRYAEHDITVIEAVLRQRDAGLALHTAIERANAEVAQPDASVFAALRRLHPNLGVQVLRKATLLALTRAIEDECCARAERPVLFASFQNRQFYQRSRSRWTELARTSKAVVLFADFDRASAASASPLRVPVPRDAPLRREWALVCDAADHPACVAGWEVLGQDDMADAERRFETVWTVDPRVVRDAAQAGVALGQAFAPKLTGVMAGLLTGTPPPASADLQRSAGLLNRMVGYVEATGLS